MNRSTSYLILFSFFYCSMLYGQINTLEQLSESYLNESPEINTPVFYEEDLLIAIARDEFVDGEFVNQDSIEYGYDSNDNLTNVLRLNWDGASWLTINREINTYDTNGNQTSNLFQIFTDGEWVNGGQNTRTFDENNNLILSHVDNWQEGEWIPEFRYNYEYNDQNQLLEYFIYQYNTDEEDWEFLWRYTYDYNADGLRISEQVDLWSNSMWLFISLQKTTYDSNNNISSLEAFSAIGSEWFPFQLVTFQYDDDNRLTKQTIARNMDGEYENIRQFCAVRNSDGTVKESVFSSWINEVWLDDTHNFFTYDDRENRTYFLRTELDSSSTWVNTGQTFYYYRIESSTSDHLQDSYIELTPNPNNGSFSLELNEISLNYTRLSIFSSTGRLVHKTASLNLQNQLNLNFLPAGSYILRLSNKEESWTERFVIQH